MLKLFLIIFYVSLQLARASVFVPVSWHEQMKDADMIIFGSYSGESKVFLDSYNQISTKLKFNLERYFAKEKINTDLLEIWINNPGGTMNGVTQSIIGTPQFKLNEKNFLVLKKDESGEFWILGLAIGKYVIKNNHVISEIFPKDKGIGNTSLDQLLPVLKKSFNYIGKSETQEINQGMLQGKDSKQERRPAQIEKNNKEQKNTFYLLEIVFFIISFAIFLYFIRRKKIND